MEETQFHFFFLPKVRKNELSLETYLPRGVSLVQQGVTGLCYVTKQ